MPDFNEEKMTVMSGTEVEALIAKMSPSLEGELKGHVLIACLTLACLIQSPTIEPELLQAVVKNTSHYMVMALNGELDIPKSKVN